MKWHKEMHAVKAAQRGEFSVWYVNGGRFIYWLPRAQWISNVIPNGLTSDEIVAIDHAQLNVMQASRQASTPERFIESLEWLAEFSTRHGVTASQVS